MAASTNLDGTDKTTPRARPTTTTYSNYEQLGLPGNFAGTYFGGDPKALRSDLEEEKDIEKSTDVFLGKPETILSSEHLVERDFLSRVEREIEEQVSPLPSWTRLDHILSILLRSESLELIRLVDEQDQTGIQQFISESNANLQTFADFVFQGLLVNRDGILCLTRLAERMIEQVSAV